MPMQCNINGKGKAVRLVYGMLLVLAGVLLVFLWALPEGRTWPWVVAGCTIGSGAFAIFEGWSGWCVLRAMGMKTPL
jgi:hypothetical protein